MIAKLKGLVDSVGEGHVVVDVNGVGYLVFCASRTLSALPPIGEAVSLSIETHVREDHIHLYGFTSDNEKNAFLLVTKVQGVGTKVALAILSVLSPDQIAQAVAAQDKAPFNRAAGVGPKLAARIVTELKDKVGGIALAPVLPGKPAKGAKGKAAVPDDSAVTLVDDAVSALVNLGYGRADAFGAVSRVIHAAGEAPALDVLIPEALKELSGDV